MILAAFPSPPQGVWYIGPVPIRAYALCIIAGIAVAIWWGERRWRARGGEPGTVTDIAVFAVPFGLVGGRLYHVATDWRTYFGPGGGEPLDALKIWEGGLGIWGAIALGAVGAWIGCRRRGLPLPAFADAVAPGIVTAQAIGRLGNYFNQELYGGPTDLPWGLEIYRRVDPETGALDMIGGVAQGPPVAVVHPTFLYELLWNLGVALLVVWADRRFRLGHGRAFALYVAGYTAGRFWIELMRTDPATMVFGLRINVITSVVVFLGAVIYLLLARRGREDPAALAGSPPDGESDRAGGESVSETSDGEGGTPASRPPRSGG
ncbi:MAG: prolipoprotein diacylglyceryl transferase [Pseudonocardiaceae bacterium]|nr:prolipoprotein diacylglyceryl transferase [Pseudonocardiaceae bacterium]